MSLFVYLLWRTVCSQGELELERIGKQVESGWREGRERTESFCIKQIRENTVNSTILIKNLFFFKGGFEIK